LANRYQPLIFDIAMKNRDDHPVWAVYDKLRTARLNVKYYSARLQRFERINLAMEYILLASAPSSAVAGLWFWNTEIGKLLWQYLGVLAAFIAVAKPPLNLTKRIKEYEGILTGYRTLEYDLMEIRTLVEQKGRYDQVLQSEFKKAMQREKALVAKTPETRENKRIQQACQKEVLRELPPDKFYVPEE
jgi:hypothetical protein